ncbi:presenilin-like protein [Achlya hypogyna]|uniref:Presenilin n=1 Tax=Achlya hypogyna TaxID=1202772 RepID=A0A1V9Y5Y4_ACHHY|nr:presenilin-like protein [Achlya hypogyna]
MPQFREGVTEPMHREDDHAALMAEDGRVIAVPVPPTYSEVATPTPPEETERQRQEEAAEEAAGDLMHGINSFWAVLWPVSITMVVASFAVVNFRSAALQASMSSYLVYNEVQGAKASTVVGQSLINALVVIGFVTVLTFCMALLYKFNCMKLLVGYIMFSSSAILGFEGGQLIDTVFNDRFHWPLDWISFLFIMVNFAFVGVTAIFYQKGIPKFIQNAYLVLVSVILAWQFSMWPEWTTWIFCFMFACYDLCAVLTPCGPLKVLIGLIEKKQAPMPGLLYEAQIRDGVGNRPPRAEPAAQAPAPQQPPRPVAPREAAPTKANVTASGSSHSNKAQPVAEPTVASYAVELSSTQSDQGRDDSPFEMYPCETEDEFHELLSAFYQRYSPNDVWKVEQVAAKFFTKQDRMWPSMFHKYMVCSCGTANVPCDVQVAIDIRAARRAEREQEAEEDNTIKLGLGDFIFYSVLVGRAAMYDFSTFIVCFICILMGLGGTLFLLSVLHKALPALPISIFLSIAFYFWSRVTFVDFCDFLTVLPSAL